MSRLTTLGVTFGYGVETEKGVKPTTFKQLELASSIGGISLDTEQIDVSALEDYITKYAAGRQDTGGTWEIEFIMDPDKSVKQIKELYSASKTAKETGLATWFEVVFPDMTDAFFVQLSADVRFHFQKLDRMKLQQCPFPLLSQITRDLKQRLLLQNQNDVFNGRIIKW